VRRLAQPVRRGVEQQAGQFAQLKLAWLGDGRIG
jgi:hypothetical protein